MMMLTIPERVVLGVTFILFEIYAGIVGGNNGWFVFLAGLLFAWLAVLIYRITEEDRL